MAYSYVTYPKQAGKVSTYSVPFGYLDRSHIRVTVGGKNTPFTWASSSLIRLSPAPSGDVTIRRRTPVNHNLIVFSDGSTYSARKQNAMALQHLYIAQELADNGGSGGGGGGGGGAGGPVYENLYFGFYRPFPEQIERIVLTGPVQLNRLDYTCDIHSRPTRDTTYSIREDGNRIGSLVIRANGTHSLSFLAGTTHDVLGRVLDISGPLNIDAQIAFGVTFRGTGNVS